MKARSIDEVQEFVRNQEAQLGLSKTEAENLLQVSMDEIEIEGEEPDFDESSEVNMATDPTIRKRASRRKKVADPYLAVSQTIRARPTKVSKIPSLLFELAPPNEYIVQVGPKDAKPFLGGKVGGKITIHQIEGCVSYCDDLAGRCRLG